MPKPSVDTGSFRDPRSRVYHQDGRVLRALDAVAVADFEAASKAPFWSKAIDRGDIIATERLTDEPASLGLDDHWSAVLEHPRLPVWTYPYEWCFSMLLDAALLQLDLLLQGLEDNISCKDATPYNVQFDGAKPVFVDVGSFETLQDGEPWYGYLQFCQLFLNPLLIQAYAGLEFQPFLRADINGIAPEVAAKVLGPLRLHKKGVLIHAAFHAATQRRLANTDDDMKSDLKKSGFKKELIVANATGLRKLLGNLTWKQAESEWSTYTEREHYTGDSLDQKAQFVKDAVSRQRRTLTWDIGCNDGYFSRMAAEHSDHVIALDGDHLVVDKLYRVLRDERGKGKGSDNIVPLYLDLTDPPPAIGWANRERTAFIDRCRPDFVLALAVIHHIVITGNVPIEEFLGLLQRFGCSAVVEFPTENDPKVQKLVRNKRDGVHESYTVANFEAIANDMFEVANRLELDNGTRVIYELTPKS